MAIEKDWRQIAIEAQAREIQLRKALKGLIKAHGAKGSGRGTWIQTGPTKEYQMGLALAYEKAYDILNAQRDDSALKEAINEIYERCAKTVLTYSERAAGWNAEYLFNECVIAIRSFKEAENE